MPLSSFVWQGVRLTVVFTVSHSYYRTAIIAVASYLIWNGTQTHDVWARARTSRPPIMGLKALPTHTIYHGQGLAVIAIDPLPLGPCAGRSQ